MNCPSCLSLMYNDTEIHQVDDNTRRMDLHCKNENCPARKIGFISNMGVLVRPNEKWECYSYHLYLRHNNKWLSLTGLSEHIFLNFTTSGKTNIRYTDTGWVAIPGGGAYNKKCLSLLISPLVEVDFIPISTDNDMHVEANKLFNRLINLVIFT